MRSSKAQTGVYFAALGLAVCTLAASCFNPFSPSVIEPGAFKPIVHQIDPDSVLHNFKYAYENRDSIVYENCLDQDFIFTYWDQDVVGEGEVEKTFFRPEDLRTTKALFRSFEDIRLDTWMVSPGPDTLVREETWRRRSVTFHLSVHDADGDLGYQSLEASGFADFLFRQSREDKLWRIVRWIDRSIR
jgi:hypothetical protein